MTGNVPEQACCNQSPIDLSDCIEAELPAIRFAYETPAARLAHGDYAVELLFEGGDGIEVEGRRFRLRNVHFHVPAEHCIDGRDYLLEAHAVHADESGGIAVVGVLFANGPAHPAFEKFVHRLPLPKGERAVLEQRISAAEFLPAGGAYYRYNGSLTTPPYSEGVRWFVMRETLTVSSGQAEALRATIGQANNRVLQPVNARRVLAGR